MNAKVFVIYVCLLSSGLLICLKTVLWARETLTPTYAPHDIRRMYGTDNFDR